jgi:TPR repeat protein
MSEDNIFDQANQQWDAGNFRNAFKMFTIAAEQKNVYAFNSLGFFFENGIGVRKDIKKALIWYRRAARSGDILAYANIGSIYRDAQNIKCARFWFLRALECGDGDAALELGKLYLKSKSKRGVIKAFNYLDLVMKSKNATQSSVEEAMSLLNKYKKLLENQ